MNDLLAHRGPDGHGTWSNNRSTVGLAHRRLSIIDLSDDAAQPMKGESGAVISYNGEIYNYQELRKDLASGHSFRTRSDTEVILAAYEKVGFSCLERLRGMFAFAIHDGDSLFCARDRFGIKPFYYAEVNGLFVFASEAKAILGFLDSIETDPTAFADYITFQFPLQGRTLFKGINELPPGHYLVVKDGKVRCEQYWDVHYEPDFDHDMNWFKERLQVLLADSIDAHLVSDVPVGTYLSGGIDSSLVTMLSKKGIARSFHGKFAEAPAYDESAFAHIAADFADVPLEEITITSDDFIRHIDDVIYHLDFPLAGPGAFPQFMVSKLAAQHVKAVLGGQGGDEIFAGYARYLIAYFEQSINAALEGTYRNGNFVVTPETIIPNLESLREYKPLIKRFWSHGLFGPMDERYFYLVNRAPDIEKDLVPEAVDRAAVYERFCAIFNSRRNVGKEAYLDSMTHFDFKTLLPALLHVEDRMSMAHGLESRVPFMDQALVEFAASVPADVKFQAGNMKHLLKKSFSGVLPEDIANRRDKMGFPVPLQEWMQGPIREFVGDTLARTRSRPYMARENDEDLGSENEQFGRKTWGLMCLELWQQRFHDQADKYRAMLR